MFDEQYFCGLMSVSNLNLYVQKRLPAKNFYYIFRCSNFVMDIIRENYVRLDDSNYSINMNS